MKCPHRVVTGLRILIVQAAKTAQSLPVTAPVAVWLTAETRHATLLEIYMGRDFENFSETLDGWLKDAKERLAKKEEDDLARSLAVSPGALSPVYHVNSIRLQAWHDTLAEVKVLLTPARRTSMSEPGA